MTSASTSLLALCLALLAAASARAQAVNDKSLGDAAQLPVDGGDGRRKLQQGGIVAGIVCASSGWCDDGRGRRYYDQDRDEGRRGDYNRGDDNRDGDRDRDGRGYGNGGYGRKLKQNVVANIVCDATGNCDDGRGNRYYDQNRDDRRRNDYNGGNNGYNDRDRNNYGRKLQQGGIVANIICDTVGNCDDGRGRRYYDGDRDERRRGDYNRDGDRDGRGYGNNGYGNDGYGK